MSEAGYQSPISPGRSFYEDSIAGRPRYPRLDGSRQADLVIVVAQTDPEKGALGFSLLVVERGMEGFERGRHLDKIGLEAQDTAELFFSDVRVPKANLLGERGRGYANFLRILDEGRIAIAALAVGAAQGCVDESVKYAKERQAFGHAIGEYQAIQFKIARMEARAHTARSAYYNAAALMLAGKPFKKEAPIAKLIASEAAMWITHQAVQIHGGMGYSKEMPIERYFRDAKITEIYEGTSEIQRLVIARNETGLR